jgi:hypothetical protein
MANNTNERFIFPDQIWYDANNPGPFHEALRQDYARAAASAVRRPSLRRHMTECEICEQIRTGVESAPAPSAGRRRLKLVVNQEQMHTLLNLPPNLEIVHMFADNDPNTVTILLAGEGLPEVAPGAESPLAPVDVAQRTPNRTS